MQQGLALAAVELLHLLGKQRVDLGVGAVDVGAARGHVIVDPRGGVAEGSGSTLHDAATDLLLSPLAQEGDPLDGLEARLDADRVEVVGHGLGHVAVGGVAGELAGIEPLRIPGLCQEPLGLRRIVGDGRRRPVELVG